MRRPAPRITVNDPELEKAFDAFSDYLDEIPTPKRVVAGLHMLSDEDDDQIVLTGTPAGSGGGVASVPCVCPFDISFTSIENSTSKKAQMARGSVNGMEVTPFEDVATVGENDTGYFAIEVTMSAIGAVTEARAIYQAGVVPPIPTAVGSPPASFFILIGAVGEGHIFKRHLMCSSISVYPRIVCIDKSATGVEYSYSVTVHPS